MQVRYDEGVAIHIGPEPCAGICEDVGEASVGESIGQPLNRERPIIPDADTVPNVEDNADRRADIIFPDAIDPQHLPLRRLF